MRFASHFIDTAPSSPNLRRDAKAFVIRSCRSLSSWLTVGLMLHLALAGGCATFGSKGSDEEELEGFAEYDDSGGLFGGLGKTKLTTHVKSAVGKGPDRDIARKAFADGDAAYRKAAQLSGDQQRAEKKKGFLQAAKLYKKAASRWPDSSMEENAMFMAADSLFFADHYFDSNELFEEMLKKYPNSRHLDRAESRRFSIAQYWEKRSEKSPESLLSMNFTAEDRPFRDMVGNAMRIYDKIRIDDPTGELADDATMAAANLHFKRGAYILADEYYTDLRRTFPNSEHQFMAHFLGLRAKMASYQGVDYSGTVLQQSRDMIKTMRTQFPLESQKHSEYLTKARAEVEFLLAERDWSDGQYYDRRKEYGAAKFHYAKLLKSYPSTPFAEKARERVEQIHGLPEMPDQKAEWLVNLFPGSGEPKLRAISDLQEGQDPTAIAQGAPPSPPVNR